MATTDVLDLDDQEVFSEYYGTKELRYFQVMARNQVAEALEQNYRRILIKMPTGTGKTITIACSLNSPRVRHALGVPDDRPLRVVFVAHTGRLLTQAERTFADDSGVELITQSMASAIPQSVIDAGWDVTVIDEAHHESCMSFQYHLEQLGDMPIIGLTATDKRADGTLIKFDRTIEPITREQAVEQHYLAETNVHTFVDGGHVDRTNMIKMILSGYANEMGNTLLFVRTKKEVASITEHLIDLGYTAAGLTNQSKGQINQVLDGFSEAKYQFVVSVQRLGEGIDVRGCDTVFIGRTIGSYPRLNQIVGRANRGDVEETNVWEIINPLSARNLDTTAVVGTPKTHRLINMERGQWVEREFNYENVARPVVFDRSYGQ